MKKQYDTQGIDDSFIGPVYAQSAFTNPDWPIIKTDKPNHISLSKWGLIPNWVREESQAMKIRNSTVNARIETIFEKPSFRQAARSQRCLVLSDGFFEFREVNKQKFPYFIQLKGGKPFTMAGLYDQWTDQKTGEVINSFSVLTTRANPLMEKIHNRKKRMPVIIPDKMAKDWVGLNIGYEKLEEPLPMKDMEAWPVSKIISSRTQSANVPEVINPFDYPELKMVDGFGL